MLLSESNSSIVLKADADFYKNVFLPFLTKSQVYHRKKAACATSQNSRHLESPMRHVVYTKTSYNSPK